MRTLDWGRRAICRHEIITSRSAVPQPYPRPAVAVKATTCRQLVYHAAATLSAIVIAVTTLAVIYNKTPQFGALRANYDR